MVVTNTVNGVTQTNVVVVTNAPAADAAEEAVAADEPAGPKVFGGGYSGFYENENGRSMVSVYPKNQGGVVSGTFTLSRGQGGTVSGTLVGFDLDILLKVAGSDKWIRMNCIVAETGWSFSGTWTDNLGNSGTCHLPMEVG